MGLKNWFHQCAEVCSSFPFFSLLNNKAKQCFCHEHCDRQRKWGGFPTVFRKITDAPPTTGKFQLISADAACEVNDEGIKRTFGDKGFSLESCQKRCLETTGCVAIDFFTGSGWCNLFDEACSTPKRVGDGSSSYRLKSGDKCAEVTCKALSQCHNAGVCTDGVCSNPFKPDGSTCDDNDSSTTNDVCRAGVCKGENNCAGVTCKALSQCHDVGVCTDGVCSNPLKADGATCDDNDSNTRNDVCRAGVCKGETNPISRVPALLDAAPRSGRSVDEVKNPDPLQKLGEVQCCKEGQCSRHFPSDSTKRADCLSGANDAVKHTFQEAIDMCEKLGSGWSLCTRTEVNSNICKGTGCGHDHKLAWAFESPALLDAAPRSGLRVPEVQNPDPLQKLGEVQCCKDGKCSRRFPSDSTSNDDCLGGMNDEVKHTFQEANEMCKTLGSGWSLCTRTEVRSNICRGKGCGHDSQLAWAFLDAPGSRRVLSEGRPPRKM